MYANCSLNAVIFWLTAIVGNPIDGGVILSGQGVVLYG